MKHLTLLLFAALLSFAARSQTNLYVDSSVTTSGAGTSWATAYKTLGEALNTVNAGSTSTQYIVNVAKGTYWPTGVQSGTNRDSAFLILRSKLTLYGGYPAGGGTRNFTANPTVLSGEINSTSITTDNSYHILVAGGFTAGTTDTLTIDGFRVTAGQADGTLNKIYGTYNCARANAGGFCIGAVQGGVKILNCTFYANFTAGMGGAILSDYTAIIISFCTFDSNTGSSSATTNGAAIANISAAGGKTMKVDHCNFKNNTMGGASSTGSAIYENLAAVSLFRDTFQNNNSKAVYAITDSGNGLFTADSCSFSGNSSSAIWVAGFNSATHNSVAHSVFSGNGAGAVYSTTGTDVTACIFNNNTGGWAAGIYIEAGGGNSLIKLCLFNNNSSTIGAGGCGGSGTIDSCQFIGNKGNTGGGVCASPISNPMTSGLSYVRNSLFVNDTAFKGGGIYCTQSTISNCEIHDCVASYGGGIAAAVSSAGSYSNFDRCRIYGNLAIVSGGGMNLGLNGNSLNTYYTLTSMAMTGNRAVVNGGGIYLRLNSGSVWNNITLAGDTAATGMALYDSAASPNIKNSIIYSGVNGIYNLPVTQPSNYGSFPTITYSLIQGGYTGIFNISSDPMFVTPQAPFVAPSSTGNYALLPCSPAINVGLNQGTYVGALDALTNPRLVGANVDMGAYEYQGTGTSASPITGGNTVCINSTLQLSNILAGGTWASSVPGVATITTNGLVTGMSAGTTTITYTVGVGSCNTTATLVLTVSGTAPAVPTVSGGSAVCMSSTLQLNGSPTGGAWGSGNSNIATVSSGGLVSAVAAGSTSITYTMGTTGCSSTATWPITVNALPVVAAISGNNSICAGVSSQYSNTTNGGVWSSSDPGVATVNSTGIVTGVAGGTDSIKYTVTNTAGCATMVYKIITVNAGPALGPITGPSDVCAGSQFSLNNSNFGGTWVSSNPAVASVYLPGLGNLLAVAQGTDTVSYSMVGSNGCATTVYYPITVDSLPVVPPIAGPATMCVKSTIQLTDATPGGKWVSGWFYAPIDSITGIVHATAPYANAVMHYTVKNGACTVTVYKQLTINGVDTSITHAVNHLESNQVSATYQWVHCPSFSPVQGEVFRQFIATSVGQYAVIVTYNGCTDTSACYNITSLGVNDGLAVGSLFEVYPNPTKDQVTVSTGDVVADQINILDVTGRVLKTMKPSSITTNILLDGYPTGIYQIEVIKGNEKQTKKLSIY